MPPPLLSPAEFLARKQAAEDAERSARGERTHAEAVANAKHALAGSPRDQSAADPEVETAPEAAGDLPPVPIELAGLDAQGLVAASDTVGELVAAMLLAARNHADDTLDTVLPSLSRELAMITLALESLRTMLEDTDTSDTLGPVAVTTLDYVSAEMLAWITGTRPATGTEHPLPAT